MNFIFSLPQAMAALGLLVLPFVLFVWKKRYWTVGSRLFYTFLTACFWLTLWALHYWSLL